MQVAIQKFDDVEGIVIPKEVLETLGLREGDLLEVSAVRGIMTMTPTDQTRSRQRAAAQQFMDKYKVALKKLAE
ncbi:AbrB family transcriptional regulator [Xaviernesmea oryzae]|uniref:AbrB family transcriptional regulator n=1 Tax=Xaviernesmea oryzae TaxID=464029 RepID=A0A1Q9AWX8_9HYPH|nr:AbrB/MazE/SpoVT family DNA-binding domain-containing protein [Xaviernesmea oryzae]OLP59962.1 AbrB family transcriptional regulator [Xaviernesmea oryzae]SEK42873.1 looped-hinge helix DNA binding domain-containing protein, AbrB family [Xaviernesmea oryzae]